MPDKKVSKSVASRPLTPSQKLDASLSDTGTVNMAESAHDKGRSTLVDKFKEREERWRREQALHEQQLEGASTAGDETESMAEGAGQGQSAGADKGGAS
jgi:hypothetical protein